jgi:peptidoglycan/xylan/chitin deacetylase (PgdA/CDA1 family)
VILKAPWRAPRAGAVRAAAGARRVAVTVDVEGDFGTDSLRGVDEVLPRLLDGFDERGIRSTLFVVGRVARARPAMVRLCAERDHLIGSHGMSHRPLRSLSRDERRAELAESRAVLEDLTGRRCDAFRAPFFDAPADLGPLLEETGYRWSSSKAPLSFVAHLRHYPATWRSHLLPGSRVVEVPVPGIFGLPIPDGLSYRRLFHPVTALPWPPPAVFYLHPYELLENAYRFGFRRWLHPLMTFRNGQWASEHLWGLLERWQSAGAVFEPPEIAGDG